MFLLTCLFTIFLLVIMSSGTETVCGAGGIIIRA